MLINIIIIILCACKW